VASRKNKIFFPTNLIQLDSVSIHLEALPEKHDTNHFELQTKDCGFWSSRIFFFSFGGLYF